MDMGKGHSNGRNSTCRDPDLLCLNLHAKTPSFGTQHRVVELATSLKMNILNFRTLFICEIFLSQFSKWQIYLSIHLKGCLILQSLI